MKEAKLRKEILDITKGNLQLLPTLKTIYVKRRLLATTKIKWGKRDITIQSAEEVLDDIIIDLKNLQTELRIKKAKLNQSNLPTKRILR